MAITSTSKDELRQLLEKRDAFATTLVVVCIDIYGTECFAWDPDMLLSELEADFNASIPQPNTTTSGLVLPTRSTYAAMNARRGIVPGCSARPGPRAVLRRRRRACAVPGT